MIYHKIEDGDEFKILPFIVDEELKWGLTYTTLYIDNKVIYDDSNILNRICHLYNNRNLNNLKVITNKRYTFMVYINNDIKFITVGKILYNIIMSNQDLNLNSNKRLKVSIEYDNRLGINIPKFDNSKFIEVNESDDRDLVKEIKLKQNFFFTTMQNRSPHKMKDLLITHFDHDYFSEILSQDREEKIDKILD